MSPADREPEPTEDAWLDEAWLQILDVARNGLCVRISHPCGHRERHAYGPPATLRHYTAQTCTRCLVKKLVG